MEIREIPIDKIKPNSQQSRENFDKEKLQELAESILSNGQINPITVREVKSGYELVAGERRWKAHKIAKIKNIQAIVKQYKEEGEWMVESLIENVHREDLEPIERAKFLKKIADIHKLYHIKDGGGFNTSKKGDINIEQLAKIVNMHRDTVGDDLKLLGFEPSEVKDIPRTSLVRISSIKDEKDKKEVLKIAKHKNQEEVNTIVKVINNASAEVKKALFSNDISPEHAEKISKFKDKDLRDKAIKEHKNLKFIDDHVETHVKVLDSMKNKREFEKNLVKTKQWIREFRSSVTDDYKNLEKTLKLLVVCIHLIPTMDESQKGTLDDQLDRLMEILERATQLSEKIKERI